MKIITKIALLTGGLVGAIPLVNAASTDTPATTVPAADTAVANHPKMLSMIERRRALRQRIAQKLNLSSDQVTQFKSIRSNTRASLQSIRSDASLTPEQKKLQVRQVLESARAQRLAVLTPDQRVKLDRIKAHLRHRHHHQS